MSTADGYVLPKPGVPKTLGILNIIFSVLLILFSFCTIAGLLAAPAMVQFAEKTVKDVQAKAEAQQKAAEKAFDDRVAEAKTDEEKKQIQQEKANYVANLPPAIQQADMSAATAVMKDPTVMGVTYGGIVTGLVLQLLLLISGIGLIRLTPWGRSLGIWWGALQIIQVALLLAANIFVVMPITQPMNQKQIEAMEQKAKGPGAGPMDGNAAQMTKTMTALAVPMAVGQSLAGMIYPVVLLILLNTAGARAACLGRKPEGPPDF